MPKVSTVGLVNKVRPIPGGLPAAVVSDDDTWLTASKTWAAGTVKLPGPSTDPDNLPSAGDFYAFGDPLGKLGVAAAVTIDGGGYLIRGAPTLVVNVAFAAIKLTFDAVNQAWIVCITT